MDIWNIVTINRIKTNRRSFTTLFNHAFFFQNINCKFFWNITKTQCIIIYFKVFCFEFRYFLALTNEKLLLPLYFRLNTNILFGCVKLMQYIASTNNAVSSIPCVCPSPRIKTSVFLLWICTGELISAPKIRIFLLMLLSVNKILNDNLILRLSCSTCIYLD